MQRFGAYLRPLGKSTNRLPKNRLRATATRALYHETDLPFFRDSAVRSCFMIFAFPWLVRFVLESIST